MIKNILKWRSWKHTLLKHSEVNGILNDLAFTLPDDLWWRASFYTGLEDSAHTCLAWNIIKMLVKLGGNPNYRLVPTFIMKREKKEKITVRWLKKDTLYHSILKLLVCSYSTISYTQQPQVMFIELFLRNKSYNWSCKINIFFWMLDLYFLRDLIL